MRQGWREWGEERGERCKERQLCRFSSIGRGERERERERGVRKDSCVDSVA